MLKIKDDVDLKELEKFDFKLYNFSDVGETYIFNKDRYDIALNVSVKNRELYLSVGEFAEDNSSTLKILYDLTKADLVEKI